VSRFLFLFLGWRRESLVLVLVLVTPRLVEDFDAGP
jgi:hypothetical protein